MLEAMWTFVVPGVARNHVEVQDPTECGETGSCFCSGIDDCSHIVKKEGHRGFCDLSRNKNLKKEPI